MQRLRVFRPRVPDIRIPVLIIDISTTLCDTLPVTWLFGVSNTHFTPTFFDEHGMSVVEPKTRDRNLVE